MCLFLLKNIQKLIKETWSSNGGLGIYFFAPPKTGNSLDVVTTELCAQPTAWTRRARTSRQAGSHGRRAGAIRRMTALSPGIFFGIGFFFQDVHRTPYAGLKHPFGIEPGHCAPQPYQAVDASGL